MDKQTKFTPGPWNNRTMGGEDKNGLQIFSGKKHLATVHYGKDARYDQAKANAKLIASAPELLNALIELCNYSDRLYRWADMPSEDYSGTAIAKADKLIKELNF